MLSLPEMWDYSLKGLAKISKDGVESGSCATARANTLTWNTRYTKSPPNLTITLWKPPSRERANRIAAAGTGKPRYG